MTRRPRAGLGAYPTVHAQSRRDPVVQRSAAVSRIGSAREIPVDIRVVNAK